MPAIGVLAIIVGFPVVFVAMWSFVCFLLAAVSGWQGMLRTYRCPEGLRGTPLPSGFVVRVGLSRYRGVMRFEAAPQGLIARVSRLFPFHPALLLPWSAIRVARTGGVFTVGEMQVMGGSTFHLNGEALTAIESAMPR